jgi:arginase
MKAKAPSLKVITAASCLGAPDQRCNLGPVLLARTLASEAPAGLVLHRDLKPPPGEGLEALVPFLGELAREVTVLLGQQQRIAVVGGDHSCAIGTWRGMAGALAAPLGLVWIDAHMDAHTPATSPSGQWHGMPVATLLGEGEPRLLAPDGAVIAPQNLCLIGVRSYEPAEDELLQRLGVKVFGMADVRSMGFEQVLAEAVAIVTRNTTAYGISIDLDGIDPIDAPAVGSPVVGGIAAADLIAGLRGLCDDDRLRLVEVAEFNPVLDVEQRTLQLLLHILTVVSGGNDESDY